MKDMIVWAVHTPAGTIGLIAAILALFSHKGGKVHRKAGLWFTASMLVMLIAGFIASILKDSTGDIVLSAFVIYTVLTAWLTVRRKDGKTGFLEYLALLWILALAIVALFISAGWRGVNAPDAYVAWAGFAVVCALGDMCNLYRQGLSSTARIIRHVWRLGFSLTWAALSVTDKIVKMTGSNVREMSGEQLLYIVGLPSLLILLLFMYWIAHILVIAPGKYKAL